MSQHREISSIPSSPQKFFKVQERYKFLQGAKVELGVHHYHFFTLLFLLTIIVMCHYYHISTQPIYLGHTHAHLDLTVWLDSFL
jgi:hypothetical protein